MMINMSRSIAHARVTALAVIVVALLGACATPINRAPVEDRGARAAGAAVTTVPVVPVAQVPAATAPDATKPMPGADNAGKPGFYSVRPGDTLIRIGLDSGQNWRVFSQCACTEHISRRRT